MILSTFQKRRGDNYSKFYLKLDQWPKSSRFYRFQKKFLKNGEKIRQPEPDLLSNYLLKGMRLAGVKRAYFIVRKGKWDIPAYMGDGKMIDMHLAYLIMDLPYGVPFTLDQAYPFIEDAIILFGFPDIVFEPKDAFVHLLSKQSESGADLVLGLFPAHEPSKMDMVELDTRGRVRGIAIKPTKTNLTFAWILAVWNHRFTQFMHKFIMKNKISRDSEKTSIRNTVQRELFMGDVIQAAIQDDINVDKLIIRDGKFKDIGNPHDLAKVVQGVTI